MFHNILRNHVTVVFSSLSSSFSSFIIDINQQNYAGARFFFFSCPEEPCRLGGAQPTIATLDTGRQPAMAAKPSNLALEFVGGGVSIPYSY